MKGIFLSVVLFISMLFAAHSAQFPFTLTCQKCSTPCSYSNCYRIVADGFNTQICGTKNCDLSLKVSMTATQCSTSTCDSGVCFANGLMSQCYSVFTALNQCQTPAWQSDICGTCSQTPTCKTKCFKSTTSTSDTASEACQDPCTVLTPFNSTILPCSQVSDQSKSSCPCCITVSGYENNYEGTCTSNVMDFDTSSLNTFSLNKFKGMNASSNLKGNFGENLMSTVFLVFLGLIGVFLV